jgi:hypothetical protein
VESLAEKVIRREETPYSAAESILSELVGPESR